MGEELHDLLARFDFLPRLNYFRNFYLNIKYLPIDAKGNESLPSMTFYGFFKPT
jgi:hypothetical protein